MKQILLILLSFFLFIQCKKDEDIDPIQKDESGVFISLPYKWKVSLHEGNIFHSNGYIKYPVLFDQNILIPTTDKAGKQYLSLVNYNTKEIQWKWNDLFSEEENMDLYSIFMNGNLLIWQRGSKSYCLDIVTGKTQWKIIRDYNFHTKLSGIGNLYFTRGYSDHFPNNDIYIGYKGSLLTGEIEELLIPEFSFNYSIAGRCCDVTEMVPYEIDGVIHLVVVYQELTSNEIWNFQSFLGLYNLETKTWIYDRKIMNEPNLNGVSLAQPAIYNNKFYANIGHELVCHDIATGNQVWKRQFEQDFMFSGFIIEENKIIANNEDLKLYCINPETGNNIWTGEGSGTSSRMSYLNGIVYFVGGGDGKLHAVDISNGKTVWRLDASKFENTDASFGPNAVYAIPDENGKKGKVVALTGMYAYCFEAYR